MKVDLGHGVAAPPRVVAKHHLKVSGLSVGGQQLGVFSDGVILENATETSTLNKINNMVMPALRNLLARHAIMSGQLRQLQDRVKAFEFTKSDVETVLGSSAYRTMVRQAKFQE